MTADLTAPTTDRTIDLDPPGGSTPDGGSWDRTLAILAAVARELGSRRIANTSTSSSWLTAARRSDGS